MSSPSSTSIGTQNAYHQIALTSEEQDAARNTIEKLAKMIDLIKHQKELEAWGEILKSTHPLKFCAFICTDTELRAKLHKVSSYGIDPLVQAKKGCTRWEYFVQEFGKQIETWGKQKICNDLPAFAEELELEAGDVCHYFYNIKTKTWRGNFLSFWNYLLDPNTRLRTKS